MVVPAALSAGRLPAPSARVARAPMALSLALHGLAVVPLFLVAGTLGSTSSQEPALIVEFSIATPTAGTTADSTDEAAAVDRPAPPEPQPPAEMPAAEAMPPLETAPQIAVDLPPPEEPPPLDTADLRPADPPKPKPTPAAPAKPATPRPTAKPAAAVAQAAAAPDTGNAAVTQQAATTAADAIVFEGRPRYRVPPKPAVYPARAIELGQQGEVLIRVRLDLDGSAAEIRLWRSSGFDMLDRSALAAVRGWHFLPAMRGGQPVAAWVEIPVRFHLH